MYAYLLAQMHIHEYTFVHAHTRTYTHTNVQGRKGKTGMVWDLEIKLIGGKNLMPKDTVGEGTYGTTFSHSSDPYVVVQLAVRGVLVDLSMCLCLSLCMYVCM